MHWLVEHNSFSEGMKAGNNDQGLWRKWERGSMGSKCLCQFLKCFEG